MNIAILGLSITSSWGNGHATTYRGLARALAARGHQLTFLERDVPWYAGNRDMPEPPYCRAYLYGSPTELETRYVDVIESADLVVVGSYVPDGIAVADVALRLARGVTAFYDIDTPVTLASLERGSAEYIERRHIPRFDLYLSFTGGPTLDRLERQFGAQRARALYCSVDADMYFEEPSTERDIDLGYLGTYSADRQPMLDELLVGPSSAWPAGRFAVVGPQYPADLTFPPNVERTMHLSPAHHRKFYNRQRYTLNITRRDMVEAGYSPSVRLFEAAACATPIISDHWPGLQSFLTPGREILVARDGGEVLRALRELPEEERVAIGRQARERVLALHTAGHRAGELEGYVAEVRKAGSPVAVRIA